MKVPEKDMPYFDLLDALSSDNCVLCALIDKKIQFYLEHLLYQSVNDSGFRKKWKKSCGFCHHHSWLLADKKDALGIAILYKDLIDFYGDELPTQPVGRKCPLCELEKETRLRFQYIITHHWPDEELKQAIENSAGLCCPHLQTVFSDVRKKDIREALLKASINKFKNINKDLEILINSYDYLHSNPTEEKIKISWRTAIEKMTGARRIKVPDK